MTDNVHIPKDEEVRYAQRYVAPTRDSRIDWDRVAREKGLHGKIQVHLAQIGDVIGYMVQRPPIDAVEAKHGDVVRFMHMGVVESVSSESRPGVPKQIWVLTSWPSGEAGGKLYRRTLFSGTDVVYLKGKDGS